MFKWWGKSVSVVKTHRGKISAGVGALVIMLGAAANATQVLGFLGINPANTPTPTAEPATVFELISLSEKVNCGSDAEVIVSTTSGKMCFLTYTTPKGNVSEANGVGTTTANTEGICSWSWHINTRTEPGIGEISIKVGDIERKYPIEVIE